MANPRRIPHKFKPWIALRQKHRLSDAEVQMARELNMDPKGLHLSVKKNGPLSGLPYGELVRTLYRERFGRDLPERVLSIEQMAAEHLQRRQDKIRQRDQSSGGSSNAATD